MLNDLKMHINIIHFIKLFMFYDVYIILIYFSKKKINQTKLKLRPIKTLASKGTLYISFCIPYI